MTGKELFEVLGDVDAALILDAAPEEQPERGKTWRRWTALAAALALIVGMGACLASVFWKSNPPTVDMTQVQWAAEKLLYGSTASSHCGAGADWNGWVIDWDLQSAMASAGEHTVLAVRVETKERVALNAFSHDGSTYNKLQSELRLCWNKIFALNELYQMRDLLKYGEALYTTGTPDGVKWTEDQYRYTIAYVGANAVEKYFVDGQFRHQLWQRDVQALEEKIADLAGHVEVLVAAYEEQYLKKDLAKFVRAGVCAEIKNGSIYLFATKGELEQLRVMGRSKYLLTFASRRAYEYSPRDTREPPVRVDAGVTGFACEKFGISTIQGGKTGMLKTDIQIIQAVNNIIKLYQYTTDCIRVTIGADTHLPEDALQDMNYSRISYSKYPTRTVLIIPYTDINMEALKDLSNREDVHYILITELLVAINAG